MKTTVRLISLLLVVLLVLCSCQSSEPEIIPEYSSDRVGIDLDGYTLKWGWAKSGNDNDDNVFGYIPGTALADTALERMKEIQSSLNCVIEMEYKGFGTIGGNMQGAILSGTQLYDLMTNESFQTLGYVRAGYFTGLSSLIDVSKTDKWGTPGMLQSVIYEDDVYSVVPYAWPELLYTTFGCPIVVNEDLISQYGHEDPREFVEEGTWTWDKFEESLHAYTVNDGERTIYGMGAHTPYYSMLMFLSNGVTLTEYTDKGIECGLYTDAGIQAMERAQSIRYQTCKDCFHSNESTSVVSDFLNGEMVLVVTNSGGILGTTDAIMYKMSNVGIIPFPQGPNAVPGVYPSYHETLLYVTGIPVNAKDAEAAATILDRMFEPFEGYETKDDIISYLAGQVFFDERDARVFVNMLENTEYGYQNDGARAAIEQVMGNNTVTEVLEGLENVYNDLLEEHMKPHYQGRLAVYGE